MLDAALDYHAWPSRTADAVCGQIANESRGIQRVEGGSRERPSFRFAAPAPLAVLFVPSGENENRITITNGRSDSGRGAAAARDLISAGWWSRFYPVAYAAQEIGGATVSVQNLTPAGAEPHDIELKPSDVVAIQRPTSCSTSARASSRPSRRPSSRPARTAIDLLAGVRLRQGVDQRGHAALDPHVWLDPIRYAAMARTIGAALGARAAAAAFVGEAACARRAIPRRRSPAAGGRRSSRATRRSAISPPATD